MNNLFIFSTKNQQKSTFFQQKTNKNKHWNNKAFIVLLTIWILLIVFGFLSLFFNLNPYQNLDKFNQSKNIKPYFYYLWIDKWQTTEINIKTNTTDFLFYKNLQSLNIDFKINHNTFADTISYDFINYVKTTKTISFLGTDSQGRDILFLTLQYFIVSALVALCLLFIELIFGIFIGLFIAIENTYFSKIIMTLINIFIAIPDIIYVFVFFIFFRNTWSIYFVIMILGFLRVIYWAYNYGKDEAKKEYVLVSKSLGSSSLNLVLFHLSKAILPKMIIIFARRIGYVIFLLGTIEFMGYHISNNIGAIFVENWKDKELNYWQIAFPSLYLATFLIINEYLAINMSKIVEKN